MNKSLVTNGRFTSGKKEKKRYVNEERNNDKLNLSHFIVLYAYVRYNNTVQYSTFIIIIIIRSFSFTLYEFIFVIS